MKIFTFDPKNSLESPIQISPWYLSKKCKKKISLSAAPHVIVCTFKTYINIHWIT